MSKVTYDSFLDLVRRSGLIEHERLNALIAELQQAGDNLSLTEPEALSKKLIDAGLITRWQSEQLLEGRYKGFFLGKYKLLDHLGTGGMSNVYLAEHVLMQRRVAIKVLPKNRVEDTSYLARFHREAQAAAALDHRNIVRAYDVDNEGSIHYLVMEFVEGRDLQQLVKQKGPLDYVTAANYMRQAAEGLSHAHRAGLIHRDVKPANLLVDQRNVVKVLDLGLARFTGDERSSLTLTYDENVLGTADYLAPEQALDSHGVDARADIYSLGCSLYYLLTGHPPFPDGTLPQRLLKHQKEAPPSIFKDRADAPKDLVQICAKMMAKKPEQRFASMADVATIMTRWLVAHGAKVDLGGSSVAKPGQPGRSAQPKPSHSSGEIQLAPDSASVDTIQGRGQPTAKGPAASGRPGSGTKSPSNVAGPKKPLPRATPLVGESSQIDLSMPLNDLMDSAQMPVLSLSSYRKKKSFSVWPWVLMAGAAAVCVIVIVLVLLAMNHGGT